MTLTNYWWLLIWLAAAGAFLVKAFPKQPVEVLGKIEYRWGWTPALILAFPYVIWAMNRSGFGDTEVYRKTFLELPASIGEFIPYFADVTKDKGFSVLSFVIKLAVGNNDKIFFLIIAAFQMLCIIYFFRKFSVNFWLCMFMFIASTDYLSWMHNGMRQFIAVCIMLLGFEFVLKKKYIYAILVILIASTIHGSALLMIPMIFVIQGRAWNIKTLSMIAVVAIAITYIDQFTTILDTMLQETQYSEMVGDEIWVTDDGTNLLRVLFYSIPAILSLVGKKYIDEANIPLINVCVNCSICASTIYLLSAFSSGIYIGRLPVMFLMQAYVSVPWIIENTFTKESAKIIRGGLVLGFIAFYYFQMHFAWGLI